MEQEFFRLSKRVKELNDNGRKLTIGLRDTTWTDPTDIDTMHYVTECILSEEGNVLYQDEYKTTELNDTENALAVMFTEALKLLEVE